MATPTAKSRGRASKTASPAVPKAPATGSIHPIPASPARPSEPRRSGWPRRSRIAAAGRTAIGIIRLRPRRWSRASATEERLRSLGVAEELAAGGRLKGSSLNSHPCRVRRSVSVPLRIQHGVQLVAVGTVCGQSQFYTLSSGEATALHHQHRASCGQTKESGVGRVADPGLDGLFPGIQQDVVLVFQYFVERALGEIDFL